MSDEQELQENPEEETSEHTEEGLPVGIARLRDEWQKLGLSRKEPSKDNRVELEPVVFPEPVGDYRVPAEQARVRLGLSQQAMERLLAGGELDSILVRFDDEVHRMVSQSALSRFIEDSGFASEAAEPRAAPAPEVEAALDAIQEQIREIRELHSRQLQQFKDILLLELRNLKEQDRDLTSFVYDLTAGLEEIFPKLKKRRRTPLGPGNEK